MAQIGSAIDVGAVVAELMKVQRIKLSRMQNQESSQKSKRDIYASLTTQIETLKTKIEGIKTSFNTIAYKAISDDENVVTAKITSNTSVSPMNHVIKVDKIAQAEAVGANNLQTSKSDALNLSGKLTFTIDGNSFDVDISTVDSLAKIRDRINDATDNNGVSASIVTSTVGGEDRYSLVIASRDTGIANKVTVSGDLESTFDFSNTISSAQDAEFTLDGASVVRSKNEIDDVIDGITFNLFKADSNDINIQVAKFSDDMHASVSTALKDMVGQYNSVITFIDTAIGNHLLNDGTAKLIKDKVKNLMTGAYGEGALNQLFDVGVKLSSPKDIATKDGKTYVSIGGVELDEAKLSEMLADQFDDVENMLINGSSSFNDLTLSEIDDLLKVGGAIPTRTQAIDEEISRINKDIDKEIARLDKVQIDLTVKYAALNTVLDKYNNISGFLDQQLAMMSNSKK